MLSVATQNETKQNASIASADLVALSCLRYENGVFHTDSAAGKLTTSLPHEMVLTLGLFSAHTFCIQFVLVPHPTAHLIYFHVRPLEVRESPRAARRPLGP
jgi:hypothetical protein